MEKETKDVIIKIKDYQLNFLRLVLIAIPREILFKEEAMTSCTNKWQALTLRNKILNNIDATNKVFGENVVKNLEKLLNKYHKEHNEVIAEFKAVKDAGTDEDKKRKAKEEAKFLNDIGERQAKEIEDLGWNVRMYNLQSGVTLIFVKYSDEKNAQDVELTLKADHNQFDFIKEQFANNLFNVPIGEDILAEICEYFI